MGDITRNGIGFFPYLYCYNANLWRIIILAILSNSIMGSKPENPPVIFMGTAENHFLEPGFAGIRGEGVIFYGIKTGIRANPKIPFAVFKNKMDDVTGGPRGFGEYSYSIAAGIDPVQTIPGADPGVSPAVPQYAAYPVIG